MEEVIEKESIVEDVSKLIETETTNLIEIEAKIDEARASSKKALDKTQETYDLKKHVFKGKDINSLKESTLEIACALDATVEAQKMLQKYQKVLTLYTEALFKLTVNNQAAGDKAIEELKNITSKYKDKKIGEETKKQIDFIIEQIKNQQSLYKRVSDLEDKLLTEREKVTMLEAGSVNKIEFFRFKLFTFIFGGLTLILALVLLFLFIF